MRIAKHKDVFAPNDLRLGADVRNGGFFYSSVSQWLLWEAS